MRSDPGRREVADFLQGHGCTGLSRRLGTEVRAWHVGSGWSLQSYSSVPFEHATDAEGDPKGSEHSRRGGGGPGQARVEPGQAEVGIELHQPLTVRWPIENEGIGIPTNGTEIVLEPWTNTGRLTVPPKVGRSWRGSTAAPARSKTNADGSRILVRRIDLDAARVRATDGRYAVLP